MTVGHPHGLGGKRTMAPYGNDDNRTKPFLYRMWDAGVDVFELVVPPQQRVYLSLLLDALDFASDLLLCLTVFMDCAGSRETSGSEERKLCGLKSVNGVLLNSLILGPMTIAACFSTYLAVHEKFRKLKALNRVEALEHHNLLKSIKRRCSSMAPQQEKHSEAQKLGLSDVLYRELAALRADCSGARASMISLMSEDIFFICFNLALIMQSGSIDAIGAVALVTSLASSLYKLRETKRYFALRREIRAKTAELEALLASNGMRRTSVVAMEQEERLAMHARCEAVESAPNRPDLDHGLQQYAALRSMGDLVLEELEQSSTFYKPRRAMLVRIERCKAAILDLQAEVHRQSAALTREDDKVHPSVAAASRSFRDDVGKFGESIRSLATSMREEPDEWWPQGVDTPMLVGDDLADVEAASGSQTTADTDDGAGEHDGSAVDLLRKTLKGELRRQKKRSKRKKEHKGEQPSGSEKQSELAVLPFTIAARCGELLARANGEGSDRDAFQVLKKYGYAGSKRTKWCEFAWILARRYKRFSQDVLKEEELNACVTRKNVGAVLFSLSRIPTKELKAVWGYDTHADDNWRKGLPAPMLELAESLKHAGGGFDDSNWD